MSAPDASAPLGFRGLLVVILALTGLTFLGYFARFGSFGFYGDEHAFFGGLINRTWASEWQNFQFCMTKWPQGRPLGMGFNLSLLPFSIFQLGGLPALHLAAGLFVVTSATLLFGLLRPRLGTAAAFLAAAFYTLAPADTVALSLVYSFNFEIAILCSLLACHCAIRGWHIGYGLLLAACLLMVEPTAMIVLFLPLALTFAANRAWLWRAALHVTLWVGVVGLILAARSWIGDPWGSERVGEIGQAPLVTLQSGLESALTGTKTHWALVGERLLVAWRELDPALAFVAALAAIVSGAALTWLTTHRAEQPASTAWLPLTLLAVTSVVTMAAIYFCYFRAPWFPANWKTGFMSGVHVVSAVAASLSVGTVAAALLTVLAGRARYVLFTFAAAALGSLAAFGNLVQRDYAASWMFQKKFWTAYPELCRDAGEGTYILILDRHLPHPRFIDLFSWGTEILPDALFLYSNPPPPLQRTVPTGEKQPDKRLHGRPPSPLVAPLRRPPRVIVTASELATAIAFDGQRYTWKSTYYFMLPKSPEEQPQAGNVIALHYGPDGAWHRLEGEQPVDGGTLRLKPTADPALLTPEQRSPLAAVYSL